MKRGARGTVAGRLMDQLDGRLTGAMTERRRLRFLELLIEKRAGQASLSRRFDQMAGLCPPPALSRRLIAERLHLILAR